MFCEMNPLTYFIARSVAFQKLKLIVEQALPNSTALQTHNFCYFSILYSDRCNLKLTLFYLPEKPLNAKLAHSCKLSGIK